MSLYKPVKHTTCSFTSFKMYLPDTITTNTLDWGGGLASPSWAQAVCTNADKFFEFSPQQAEGLGSCESVCTPLPLKGRGIHLSPNIHFYVCWNFSKENNTDVATLGMQQDISSFSITRKNDFSKLHSLLPLIFDTITKYSQVNHGRWTFSQALLSFCLLCRIKIKVVW